MAENFLTKEVAGQPVGVWAVVVAGGLGIAYVLNKGQQDSESAREPLIEPGVGTGLVPAGAGFQSGNGGSGDTDTGPENNLQWGNEAKNWLVGQGHNATTVDRAVNKYLEGQQLTSQEDALVSQAISQLGAPPEGSVSADPPEQESSVRVPRIEKTPADMKPQPMGTRPTFSGRVFYDDGSPPGQQLVTVTISMWGRHPQDPQLAVPASKQLVETDESGNFSVTLPGVSGRSNEWIRRYTFSWKGTSVQDRVRFLP